ncbi:MAG: Tn3 family transposase [Proteobacteria bacterium]|nr:Tn3 family transposase [Pseudomonadota bacterium]MBU4294613.1 Tn3 family transposase [Pseudomonadota bacterium]
MSIFHCKEARSRVEENSYQSITGIQLNRGEGRHSLACAVFHGKRGELRQHYRVHSRSACANTSCTLAARSCLSNGFWMKCIPSAKTP